MKNNFIMFFTLLVVSCGADPLIGSFKEKGDDTLSIAQGLGSSSARPWPGNERMKYALSWKEKPSYGQKSSFFIKFWDIYQSDILGPYQHLENKLCVFLWMRMPDGNEHGSSPVTLVKKDDYHIVDDIYFIMSGNWEVRIRTVEHDSHCTSLKRAPFISEDVLSFYVK